MFIPLASERPVNTEPPRITFSIARSRSELEDAFRLVHHSYVRAGLDLPNDTGLRLTPFHFVPTTEVMLAKCDGVPISTASLFLDDSLGLPAESIYRSEIAGLRSQGLRLAEVGSFADRRESVTRFIAMFRRLSTILAQAAAIRGCTALIAATHPKHARFYVRQLGFEQFGARRDCPYVQGKPAVALVLDFEKQRGGKVHEHLFGQEYPAGELQPYDWDDDTRDYFRSVLQQVPSQAAVATQQPVGGAFGMSPAIELPQPAVGID